MEPAELTRRHHILIALLRDYTSPRPPREGWTYDIIADQERGHYLACTLGWHGQDQKGYGIFLHLRLRHTDGNIELWHNGTEDDIPALLSAQGIPPNDIILSFQPPYMRPAPAPALAA